MSDQQGMRVGRYEISLNNKKLDLGVTRAITQVVVEDEINTPAMFSINLSIFTHINTGSGETIQKLDRDLFDLFQPGVAVEISMGGGEMFSMITGNITALEPEFNELPTLQVRGFDMLYDLRFGTKRRSFKDSKDSDIVNAIAKDVKMTAEIEQTETVYPFLFQNNQSNYEFLMERTKRINYEIKADGKKLIFRSPGDNEGPAVSIEFGKNLVSFYPRLNTLTSGSSVEVRGWNMSEKSSIVSQSQTSDASVTAKDEERSGFDHSINAFAESPVAVVDDFIIDAQDAAKVAKAKYNQAIQKFINGEGTSLGNPDIRAGKTIEVLGVGALFSGVYYVVSSTHTVEDGIYLTKFRVRRPNL